MRPGILVFDKVSSALVTAIIIVLAFNVITFLYSADLEKKNDNIKPGISRMQSLPSEAQELKKVVESKEKKIVMSKATGIVSTLEQMLKGLGLKAKTIKPLDKKKREGYLEEKAELEIEDTDLNSIVNLLYKMENSHAPLKVNSAFIKTAFENPDKFVLKLSVSLLSKG